MTPGRVEEIKTVSDLLNRDGILLRAVLENKLLQVEECPFVGNFLSNLHQCSPGVLRSKTSTIRALAVLNEVLDFECLLEYSVGEDLERR